MESDHVQKEQQNWRRATQKNRSANYLEIHPSQLYTLHNNHNFLASIFKF